MRRSIYSLICMTIMAGSAYGQARPTTQPTSQPSTQPSEKDPKAQDERNVCDLLPKGNAETPCSQYMELARNCKDFASREYREALKEVDEANYSNAGGDLKGLGAANATRTENTVRIEDLQFLQKGEGQNFREAMVHYGNCSHHISIATKGFDDVVGWANTCKAPSLQARHSLLKDVQFDRNNAADLQEKCQRYAGEAAHVSHAAERNAAATSGLQKNDLGGGNGGNTQALSAAGGDTGGPTAEAKKEGGGGIMMPLLIGGGVGAAAGWGIAALTKSKDKDKDKSSSSTSTTACPTGMTKDANGFCQADTTNLGVATTAVANPGANLPSGGITTTNASSSPIMSSGSGTSSSLTPSTPSLSNSSGAAGAARAGTASGSATVPVSQGLASGGGLGGSGGSISSGSSSGALGAQRGLASYGPSGGGGFGGPSPGSSGGESGPGFNSGPQGQNFSALSLDNRRVVRAVAADGVHTVHALEIDRKYCQSGSNWKDTRRCQRGQDVKALVKKFDPKGAQPSSPRRKAGLR